MTDPIQNGYGAQAIDQEAIYRALQGSYISSGCTPSKGTNALEVDIASGVANVDGTEVSVSAQTVTLTAGDTDPRKDLIYLDSTGTAQVAPGTPAPAQPTGETRRDTYQPQPVDLSGTVGVVVAEVWVPSGASDITSGDISDRRPVLTVSGQANTPPWTEDPNSPFTASNTQNITASLADTYDYVRLKVRSTELDGNSANIGMQVNGDTGSNYDYVADDGTTTTGATSFENLTQNLANTTNIWSVEVESAYNGGLTVAPTTNRGTTFQLEKGGNGTVSHPLTQVTLLAGTGMDWTVRVYGLNL